MKTKIMTTSQLTNSIHSSLRRYGLFLIPLLLCFALLPRAQAVGPDTDGSIPGSNNGEGIGVLVSRTTGVWNTGTGFGALNHLTTGNQNTATGLRALFSDTSGSYNTANGVYALYGNTIGWYNNAVGAYSLANNTEGSNNTANGFAALHSNTAGGGNVANGYQALFNNTDGGDNTANGVQALYSNTSASLNTANGFQALFSNTTGYVNTATGKHALYYNTTGADNTANGFQALFHNTTAAFNTATGASALFNNIVGGGNTADGGQALVSNTTGNSNTANGLNALRFNTSGSNNTALGVAAGSNVTTANNIIAIGANVSGENVSNTSYIGNIFGVTSAGATAVYVNSLGKLGTVVSSRRFKEEIKPMDKASEAILALKPVIFRYKQEIDPARSPQFGLVAEDVEKVNPDLVVRDMDGKVNTVRYEVVNAMLLNEFIKEHRKVEQQEMAITELRSNAAKQEATIALQQHEIQALTASLKEQSAQILKVSAQLETTKPASRMANNNQ
jgi:uncharacterized coiled-coil protein SlyX